MQKCIRLASCPEVLMVNMTRSTTTQACISTTISSVEWIMVVKKRSDSYKNILRGIMKETEKLFSSPRRTDES